jgi:protein farnesyltransferase subunit beta
VATLATVGTREAYESIDREKLYRWLLSLKQPDGSFLLSHGGEIDVRGSYCALTVASLLNIMTDTLTRGCGDFIAQCQTYEGGLGARPGVEAHGGYTFCGLASMLILNETAKLDMRRLTAWSVKRQMRYEGGFQGRTNKLVDGCYAFWCGGLFPLIQQAGIGKTHDMDVLSSS